MSTTLNATHLEDHGDDHPKDRQMAALATIVQTTLKILMKTISNAPL